jgi:hypothetical protein
VIERLLKKAQQLIQYFKLDKISTGAYSIH